MPDSTYTLRITGDNGEVIIEETFEIPENTDLYGVGIQVMFESKPELPSRSPHHPKSLNLDDLERGMNIRRHNTKGNDYKNEAIINGEPFKHGDKHGPEDLQADALMIPVVTTNHAGKLVHEDWFLSDMGIVPYIEDSGPHWNKWNYTLAVD